MSSAPTPLLPTLLDPASSLTIRRLGALLWGRRWVFSLTFLATVGAVLAWAMFATPTYRATATLMPRQSENLAGGLQSLFSQFGGLASLAGIDLSASVDEQESIAWLRSRAFGERFIEQHNMLPLLFSDQWDSTLNQWRSDLEEKPSIEDAWLLFDRQIRRVTQDTRTRLVTLEIRWKDRHQAAAWANELVRQANEELRQRALREADASLEALQRQLDRTDTVGLRQSIYRLMEVQLNRKVVASSRPDYAFTVLDPAVPSDPDRIASPRRTLLALISVPLGAFIASLAAIVMQVGAEVRVWWNHGEKRRSGA